MGGRVIHLVPGLDDEANGIAVAARLIAGDQGAEVEDCSRIGGRIERGDEVWVHSMWTPQVWRACWYVLRQGAKLVRMTHGCLDPLRVAYHGWKKRLVTPIERWLFARCDRVVVTGEWEAAWCRHWGVRVPYESVDLKRFFPGLGGEGAAPAGNGMSVGAAPPPPMREDGVHLLFLGRRHPLKGLEFLAAAVREVNGGSEKPKVELRVVSNAFGEEKERVWDWCDVLVLPTLSENFGLVVAEALERGKRVITTDGAPAWRDFFAEHPSRGVCLEGFRAGTDAARVSLLRAALERECACI